MENLMNLMKSKIIFILIFTISINLNGQENKNKVSMSIDQLKIKKIIEIVINSFEEHYLYPEKVTQIKNVITNNLEKGKYNNIRELNELTKVLRTDLYKITKDYHIGFSVINNASSKKTKNKTSLNSETEKQLLKRNFYFPKLEILSGNIGYLRLDRFKGDIQASKTAIAAMNFLANTDAIIIDLRYNSGGGGPVGQILASYFFDEPTILGGLYFPAKDSIVQNWTHGIPEKKFLKKELYILTSNQTASAAEWFSSAMQTNQRAKIIGEVTKGAAHWREYYFYPEISLEIKMPIARPLLKDWERKGIIPDVYVIEHLALKKTHIIALQELLNKAKMEYVEEDIEWYLKIAKMKLDPLAVVDENLKIYSGLYGKSQKIILKEGNLFWHQSESEEYVLLPIAKDSFVFSDSEDYIVQFIRNTEDTVIGYKLLNKSSDNPKIRKKMD